jgi:hypothetical protein
MRFLNSASPHAFLRAAADRFPIKLAASDAAVFFAMIQL